MQWQKAKTILIVVFLLINILLLSYLFYDSHGSDNKKFADLTTVLARNGIHLAIDHLPDATEEIFVPEFYAPPISKKLAESLIENPVQLADGSYSDAGETCQLTRQDGVLFYENPSPNQKKFRNLTAKNAVSKLRPYLKALGITELVYPVDISEIGDETIVEFQYRMAEHKLFDASLTFTLSTRGIKKIRGFWGIPDTKNGFSYRLARLETILLSLGQDADTKLEITAVESGYYFFRDSDAMISQAIPAYQFRTSQGNLLLDARDGVSPEERTIRQSR